MAEKLRALVDAGVPAYFIRGNRDFLLGESFAARCGMTLLDDPSIIDLYGTKPATRSGKRNFLRNLCKRDWPLPRKRARPAKRATVNW